MKSPEDVNQELLRYSILSKSRDKKILTALGFILIITLVLVFYDSNQGLITSVCLLAMLAIYVVITSRYWHSKNSIFCKYCSVELATDEIFQNSLDACLAGRETNVHCPRCNEVIAESL